MVLSAAMDVIRKVEAAGGRFEVDGDRLGVVPKEAAVPVLEELVRNKAEILVLLREREAVRREPFDDLPVPAPAPVPLPEGVVLPDSIVLPKGVRLTSWTPREPPIRLNEYTTVVDAPGVKGCELFISTTLRQLEHEMHGRHWLGGGWGGVPGLLDRLKAVGLVVEVIVEPPRPKGGAK